MSERNTFTKPAQLQNMMIWAPAILIWLVFAVAILPTLSPAAAQSAEPVATENTVRRTVTRTVRRIEADGTETIVTEPVTSGAHSSTYATTTSPTTTRTYTSSTSGTTQSYTPTTRTYTSSARTTSEAQNSSTTTTRSYTRYVNGTTETEVETGSPTVTTTTRTYSASSVATTPASAAQTTRTVTRMVQAEEPEMAPYVRSSDPSPVQTASRRPDAPAQTQTLSQSQTVRRAAISSSQPVTPEVTRVVAPVQRDTVEPRPTTRTPSLLRNALAPTSYDVPEMDEIHQIIWSTLVVINEAQMTGNYSRFMLILSPRMRGEVTADILPSHFRSLEQHRAEMVAAIGREPEWELQPHMIADGRLRLRGSFALETGGIRFDLMYQQVNGTWFVDAIAFAQLR